VSWQAAVATPGNHCDQDDSDTHPLAVETVGGGSSVAAAVFVWCSILNYDFSYYSAFFFGSFGFVIFCLFPSYVAVFHHSAYFQNLKCCAWFFLIVLLLFLPTVPLKTNVLRFTLLMRGSGPGT
jgi:hypothetical protein